MFLGVSCGSWREGGDEKGGSSNVHGLKLGLYQ